jgi:asparagine synthase (glutamine-hydrolysing)
VGEKPLYYFRDQEGFYFSSEIKSFFGLDNFERKISTIGLHSYFNYVQIPSPQTLFDGVKKLQSAHWLFIKPDGNETLKPYWHIDCTKKNQVPMAEAKDHLKELILDSVKKALVSDVPVGLMLSGGVDSSLILALAKEVGGNFTTFTVGSDSHVADDEYVRVRKVASKYDVENRTYDFSSADFSELITAVGLCDEPIGLLDIF